MAAAEPTSREEANEPSAEAPGDGSAVEQAREDLQTAFASRKVIPICNAYQQLRRDAGPEKAFEILQSIRGADDRPGADLVYSAYSHRHCYMCDRGTMACDPCGGSGALPDGGTCGKCQGLGVRPCGFCAGTHWTDRNELPEEIHRQVLGRQLGHVRGELQRLAATVHETNREALQALPPEQHDKMVSWLIRLRARLTDLADTDIVDAEESAHMKSLAEKVSACLAMLRKPSR